MEVLGPLVLGAPDPHAQPTRLSREVSEPAPERGAVPSLRYRRVVDAAPPRLDRVWVRTSVLAAIVAFGAWTRASGFTRGSLWFDDAWTALVAHVPLSTATRMVTTAPGYTIGLRTWLRLGPDATWWAQLPAFVAGLAGIVAVYALLRYFTTWWPLPYVGALVLAVSPVAVAYSTRVKQFGLDLLCACLLLWLYERWRRAPRLAAAVALAVACAASLLVSATTLAVAVSVSGVAVVAALCERSRARDALVVAATTLGTVLVSYVLWLRHLEPSLHYGWTKRGYLLSTTSAHRIVFSLEAMGTGFFHWMLGVPTDRRALSSAVTPVGLVLALLAGAVLVAVTVPPIVSWFRSRGRVPGPLATSSCAVVLAVLLALGGRSPFGGGRTDEVLYPSVLLLAAGLVTSLVAGRPARVLRRGLVVLAVVACVLAVVGIRNRAVYPTTQLRPLAAAIDAHLEPGDVIVVDPWLTFTWADDQLSPTTVSFARTVTAWSNGYHVVSLDPNVVISQNAFLPDASYRSLPRTAKRLWYVAVTLGRQSSIPGHPNRLERTLNYDYLRSVGWTPAGTYLTAGHTEAVLLVYRPGR